MDEPWVEPDTARGRGASSARRGRLLAAAALALAATLIGGAILAVALGERACVSMSVGRNGREKGSTMGRRRAPPPALRRPGPAQRL